MFSGRVYRTIISVTTSLSLVAVIAVSYNIIKNELETHNKYSEKKLVLKNLSIQYEKYCSNIFSYDPRCNELENQINELNEALNALDSTREAYYQRMLFESKNDEKKRD